MSRYEPPRFRITTSPPVVVAPVRITAPLMLGHFLAYGDVLNAVEKGMELSSDGVAVDRLRASRSRFAESADDYRKMTEPGGAFVVDLSEMRTVDVPPDLFLRGLLGDFEALIDMLTDLGPARPPAGLLEAAGAWRTLRVDERDPEWHWREVCGAVREMFSRPDPRAGHELIVLLRAEKSRFATVPALSAFPLMQQLSVLGLYRAVAVTALELPFLTGDQGPDAFREVQEFWSNGKLPVPVTADQAVVTTGRVLNLTTADLGPRLELLDDAGVLSDATGPGADLLGALSAQILAHVSEGIPVRRCAHAPCGKWFTHQQGRSRYGQHRATGVQYCTAGCARAAAQQRYRQRQRARRGGQGAQER